MAEQKLNIDLNFQSTGRVKGALPGTANGEYVTYEQLTGAIEGLSPKDNVRAASSANVNLTAPGAAIDGITMSTGDRILLTGQTLPEENGIYIWNGAATPVTRAPDASTGSELLSAIVAVDEGTLNGGKVFRQASVNITLGTTPIAFMPFGQASTQATETSAGVGEIATQAEIDAGTSDTVFLTPLKLKNWSNTPKRYTALIGDASLTQIDVAHNLNSNTTQVQVYIAATGETILCQVTRLTLNTVRLNFNVAPALNAYRVVVIA
jgi:hypothetical protein